MCCSRHKLFCVLRVAMHLCTATELHVEQPLPSSLLHIHCFLKRSNKRHQFCPFLAAVIAVTSFVSFTAMRQACRLLLLPIANVITDVVEALGNNGQLSPSKTRKIERHTACTVFPRGCGLRNTCTCAAIAARRAIWLHGPAQMISSACFCVCEKPQP